MQDMRGTVVTEEEAAIGLGFASVAEMRRWDTEMGQKVADLEHQLHSVARDRDQFLWHGRRMQAVLEKVLEAVCRGEPLPPDLVLAIGVVLGKEVDWGGKLKGWF